MKNTLLFLVSILFANQIYAQVAFPCAEGFGALTTGGRGGKVMYVTNTNESGAGSLRAAIEATGKRIVLFKVSGVIESADRLTIKNGDITIAGQTAPGDGICLKGGGFSVQASNVIIRGIRSRPGDGAKGPWLGNRDAIEIIGPNGNNIIIDHCSFSWGVDENTSTWYNGVKNVTFQWNIISEGLLHSNHPSQSSEGHSMGLLIGDFTKKLTVHHNYFAHNAYRNPYMKGGTESEVINNVIYNWGQYEAIKLYADSGPDYTLDPSFSNIIGNYFKKGPQSTDLAVKSSAASVGSKIYLKGNIGPMRLTDTENELNIATGAKTYYVTSPALVESGVATESASSVVGKVLESAGAFPRDKADLRVVSEYKNGTGKIIDSPTEVGGWQTYASTTAPTDTDNDGMPDTWENSKSLNPNDAKDGILLSASGYTWVEEYINSLLPCKSTITVAEEKDNHIAGFSIQPNPAKNELFIIGDILENAKFEITTLEGKSLQNGIINSSKISIENLEVGLYIIKIKSNAGESMKRFVKE